MTTDSDYSTIRPVEGLQTVLGVAPTEQRQQQQRKSPRDNREEHAQPQNAEEDEQVTPDDSDPHSIDYRA